MVTQTQLLNWLDDDSSLRCVLVEVDVLVNGVETTRYLSNRGYVTGASDTPANTAYDPCMVSGFQLTEQLQMDGTISMTYGNLEILNIAGEKDSWTTDVWNNRQINIYLGDVRWARSDFYQVFGGVVVTLDSSQRDKLNIVLSDKLQNLNTVITETVLGGTSANKDKIVPLLFGECHNITPLLVDSGNLIYQVHQGPIEQIIEVRDNGVPVSITPLLSQGQFQLNQQPVGTITVSAQGDNTGGYVNDVVGIIKRLVTQYGSTYTRLTNADINLDALNAFATANPQPIGIYLDARANVVDTCNQIAQSVGATVTVDRGGLLKLVKLDPNQTSTGTTVTETDVVEQSMYLTSNTPSSSTPTNASTASSVAMVTAGVKLGYCKNWTVQQALQTGLPADDIALFAQEYLTVTVGDLQVAQDYKIYTLPVEVDTLLLVGSDAQAEATRRLNMFNVPRRIVHYTGTPKLLMENLGDPQTINNYRFGLENGVTGQIVTIVSDWMNATVELEVLY